MALEMRTGLEGKPWWHGVVAGLLVAVGIYALMHFWQLKPKTEELEQKEDKLRTLQAKIQEGRAAEAQLPQFRAEVQQLELELEKLLRILPARRNTQDLLRRIRGLAEQGDFDLLRFRPGRFREQEFYSEWPITISLDGNYHNLALFFDRVGKFSRIINIEDLRVEDRRGNDARRTIRANFEAKTFIYNEPELDPVAEEAQP